MQWPRCYTSHNFGMICMLTSKPPQPEKCTLLRELQKNRTANNQITEIIGSVLIIYQVDVEVFSRYLIDDDSRIFANWAEPCIQVSGIYYFSSVPAIMHRKFQDYVKWKIRFPKSGPTYRRQVINPRHQLPQGKSVAKQLVLSTQKFRRLLSSWIYFMFDFFLILPLMICILPVCSFIQ